jgi:hypothetical protein
VFSRVLAELGLRKISSQGTAKLLALAWPWLGPAQAMAVAQSQKKPKPSQKAMDAMAFWPEGKAGKTLVTVG